MAEELRGIREIYEELFKGPHAALLTYKNMRQVQREMKLYRDYGYPLSMVKAGWKKKFSDDFLGGKPISSASEAEMKEAYTRLDHAVRDGCHKRCYRLVEELKAAYQKLGVETNFDTEKFLNLMTFDFFSPLMSDGQPYLEPGYGFPIQNFVDDKNRKDFWQETSKILRAKKIMSVSDIWRRVMTNRRAVDLPVH